MYEGCNGIFPGAFVSISSTGAESLQADSLDMFPSFFSSLTVVCQVNGGIVVTNLLSRDTFLDAGSVRMSL